jgi:hypothetical protein
MVQKLCSKFLRLAQPGRIINAFDALNCSAADAISQYSYGEPFGEFDNVFGQLALADSNQYLTYRIPR